jgi:hypothetical protein
MYAYQSIFALKYALNVFPFDLNEVLLIQTQEMNLYTPHPFASLRAGSDPLPQGERGLHKLPPPLTGGGKGGG